MFVFNRIFYNVVQILTSDLSMISQFVGVSEVCDQNGNKVSNSNKSYPICSMLQKSFFL